MLARLIFDNGHGIDVRVTLELLRQIQGLRQYELAETLGVDSQTVARWEAGKFIPELKTFGDLATTLRVTTSQLFELLDEAKHDKKT